MECGEFDALLTEALDGTLAGEQLERFRVHADACSNCGPLFVEIEAGRRLLHSIAEVEPPAHLLHNILAATSGLDTARLRAGEITPSVSWLDRIQQWLAPITPVFAVVRQPRFAMSFGMAFFSLSMALNLAGVRIADLRHADLRPSAIVREYHMTTGKVVKYYENIRFVYEIESRVRDFKRATTPAEPAPRGEPRHRDNNTSQQPEPRQERNYSQGENQPVLALARPNVPVAAVTASRRLA